MRTAKTLIRLGAHEFCWFSHEVAHWSFKESVVEFIFTEILLHSSISVCVYFFEGEAGGGGGGQMSEGT